MLILSKHLRRLQITTNPKPISRLLSNPQPPIPTSLYSSKTKSKKPKKKKKKNQNPTPEQDHQFNQCISNLPPRPTPEDLSIALSLQPDPFVRLRLFHYASNLPRFRHDSSTYLPVVRSLASSPSTLQDLDSIVSLALSSSTTPSEDLFNAIIESYSRLRKVSRLVNVYTHMRRCGKCRPSLVTYNLLFDALLGRGPNSTINYAYMENVRCLFRQMLDDGIEPDVSALNSMIAGYIGSMCVNDALRLFHQMGGVVYKCAPDAETYGHLIHGLCAEGRTENAREIFVEMGEKGFVLGERAYNSMVCAVAVNGEVDEAVRLVWEMKEHGVAVCETTYRTVVEEVRRRGGEVEVRRLLTEMREGGILDGLACRRLLCDGSGRVSSLNFNARVGHRRFG
ncbi:Pentatricopeptide repeat-containing protein [Acorus calamus]|uniref:Pentatricopeptide repeat-containing protein n=1 Tax=Acorus calamus TaxID=4465 RepID=A0AAV9ETJ3_ACOCL|nr:Pentatricopeptide repeat-containing protein [Acorus calamus]